MKIGKINTDICNIHEDKYISYCLDCKKHLCFKCLKIRNHINHNKNNIIEIAPDNIDLEIIKGIINYYNSNINELENYYKKEFIKENNEKDNSIKKLNEKETNELNMNKNKYISKIEEIKKKYIDEMIRLKSNYNNNLNNIRKKYKICK